LIINPRLLIFALRIKAVYGSALIPYLLQRSTGTNLPLGSWFMFWLLNVLGGLVWLDALSVGSPTIASAAAMSHCTAQWQNAARHKRDIFCSRQINEDCTDVLSLKIRVKCSTAYLPLASS
jgi:type II secretory pathway component PulF